MLSSTPPFLVFAAVIGTASMVTILGYFLHRIRQIEASGDSAPSRALVEQVSGLQEELLAIQSEMSALTDRLDFAEKLLTGDGGSSTPGSEE